MLVGDEKKVATLKFKMPFCSAIWLLFIGNLMGLVLLLPFILKDTAHIRAPLQSIFGLIGLAVFLVLVLDVILSLIFVECFKIKLKPSGISCFNFWGVYSFVLWGEIHEIKTINFLGLKYARLFFRTARFPLWVPLFIKNQSGFSKALSEFAPPSNLLRQAFMRKG